jgi:MOSC domain-containing protein YiiM
VEHATVDDLEAGLEVIRQAPSDVGEVVLIVLRPEDGERSTVERADLDVVSGVVGDNWSRRPNRHSPDGGPDPRAQVTIMNARIAALLAGDEGDWTAAGDQLYVDFDLSEHNLPPGTRLAIGTAVVEVSDKPHNGCAKFRRRFGDHALRFVNSPTGKRLHLRGINARVVQSGDVRVGSTVRKR